ncbi:envelope stress response activation lipoprotein NlpE [Leclercia adecarboxylata]|uniref:Envelope stress response activation lipoprotein NlpE n=2 Tax=Leclercia adecarboxylata TaxID=83655 RepID=A0A9X4BCA1_9ENTR|nr:envelope stress response activation lipoprotein NlpE [Leclercia adecarboxylata]MDU5512992.1 envelope stress response activation lipoprotein NlpE [Enterobacter sp.]MBD1405473.1 envelope stress response activation lipoprotein NlpE [Leclercia adecarboxylata]MBZ3800882.1 envelope stress response activation lipoprotein NlpE [Leclercia adecarboxylata]MBZ3804801.1 envelope stress response activation lipoprotein NlpE [Leclercia adecarboxylata]MCE9978427.1 envelope stress response activation lipopro
MKSAIFSVVAASALFVLMGCHNRAEMEVLEPTQAEALKPMQQSWRGVLPCADCEGIETSLFLEKDGTWVMNQHYQGAKAPSTFASYGTWARTADKLVLTDTAGEKRYFRAKGEGLEMLDMQGNPIVSQFNYTLAPVTAALPATPMAMRGMYFYMADAAIFTDCATGKKVSVANNAQLERDYAAARGNDTKPVLLTVDGHFTLQANPDSGEKIKTLVPDRDARFEAGKNCDSK